MTTRKEIRATVERLQRKGADIAVGWAYGRPRCSTKDEGRDLSPRLPTGQMATWLEGYECGFDEFAPERNKSTIILEVLGGVVQSVIGIPKGITVEVRDFDVEGAREDQLTDFGDDGKAVVLTWGE